MFCQVPARAPLSFPHCFASRPFQFLISSKGRWVPARLRSAGPRTAKGSREEPAERTWPEAGGAPESWIQEALLQHVPVDSSQPRRRCFDGRREAGSLADGGGLGGSGGRGGGRGRRRAAAARGSHCSANFAAHARSLPRALCRRWVGLAVDFTSKLDVEALLRWRRLVFRYLGGDVERHPGPGRTDLLVSDVTDRTARAYERAADAFDALATPNRDDASSGVTSCTKSMTAETTLSPRRSARARRRSTFDTPDGV